MPKTIVHKISNKRLKELKKLQIELIEFFEKRDVPLVEVAWVLDGCMKTLAKTIAESGEGQEMSCDTCSKKDVCEHSKVSGSLAG